MIPILIHKPSIRFMSKKSRGPEGLRSLGSPIMSRLLYQAELRALKILDISSV